MIFKKFLSLIRRAFLFFHKKINKKRFAFSPKPFLIILKLIEPYFFPLILHVLIPKGAYSGQKLIKLVNTKIPASTNRTIPSVPVMVSVKYKVATIAAMMTLIILSAAPMFFFIIVRFVVSFFMFCF